MCRLISRKVKTILISHRYQNSKKVAFILLVFNYSHLGGKGIEGKEIRTAMNIKLGEIFKNSTDGMDFIVKKFVKDRVVLESYDGKRQILTEVHTLTSTLFYLKRGGEES